MESLAVTVHLPKEDAPSCSWTVGQEKHILAESRKLESGKAKIQIFKIKSLVKKC